MTQVVSLQLSPRPSGFSWLMTSTRAGTGSDMRVGAGIQTCSITTKLVVPRYVLNRCLTANTAPQDSFRGFPLRALFLWRCGAQSARSSRPTLASRLNVERLGTTFRRPPYPAANFLQLADSLLTGPSLDERLKRSLWTVTLASPRRRYFANLVLPIFASSARPQCQPRRHEYTSTPSS